MKLTPMQKYDIDSLRCLGWIESGAVLDGAPLGYSAYDYFRDGLYLGPDEYGIEPYFEAIDLKSAAALMGRKGGSAKSEKKTAAVRENAKKSWDKRNAKKVQP